MLLHVCLFFAGVAAGIFVLAPVIVSRRAEDAVNNEIPPRRRFPR